MYLCVTTRFFLDPVSVVVKGDSSGGKSYTTGGVLKFFPPDACIDLTSMSEKALIYAEKSFEHRFLWIYEAAGLENPSVRYMIRTLLSEGRIKYLVTGNTAGGRASKTIEKEGPTGLILTTTLKFMGEDQENRLLSIPINVSPNQTRQILVGQAEEAEGELSPSDPGGDEGKVNLSAWHEFQEWLRQSDQRVVIPYAKALVELINPVVLRIRRDFTKVCNLIRAHALLHQLNRDRNPAGKLIAKLTDYSLVYKLIHGPLQLAHETAIPQHIRDLVEAINKASEAPDFQGISGKGLTQILLIHKSNVSRGVKEALEKGFIRNREDRRGRPAKYVPDNPLPSNLDILPSPQELKAVC